MFLLYLHNSGTNKRKRQVQKMVKQGLMEAGEADAFQLFLSATDIRGQGGGGGKEVLSGLGSRDLGLKAF